MRRRLIPFLSLIAIALAAAPAVSAARPVSEVFSVDPFTESVTCGYPITSSFDGYFKATRFFDRTGTVVKEILVAPTFTVTFSANGKSLFTRGPAPVIFSGGQAKVVGLIVAIHLPGQGVIALDAGHIVYDGEPLYGSILVEHGPHDLFGSGDRTAFCAYFLTP